MPVDWDPPLRRTAGGRFFLAGLVIYHDFEWKQVFPHGRGAFRGGRSLALATRKDCPAGKTPCLLLTTRHDVAPATKETDTHYVVIVPIKRYLRQSSGDRATTFFAKELHAPGGITSLHRYEQAIQSIHDLDAILNLHLDEPALLRWVGKNSGRIATIRRLADALAEGEESEHPADQPTLAEAITAVEKVTPELCDAMVSAVNAEGPAAVRRMAAGLSSNTAGRETLLDALADRTRRRIADVRSASREYRELAERPDATETELHGFIRKHPWLLGLEYVRVLPKQQIVRGEVDFLVQRHDGYHDLLELKGPNDEIVRTQTADEATPDRPHPPSGYSLGPALAQALAQVQHYRKQLTGHAAAIDELYGIRHTRDARVTIIIGRASDLSETEEMILRQLNQSLHRMEVIPYDVLAARADAQLDNLEELLATEIVRRGKHRC